jgi:hypothetical protein
LRELVLDLEGVPIEAAKIAVSGPDLQGIRETTTGERGHYFLLALPVEGFSFFRGAVDSHSTP